MGKYAVLITFATALGLAYMSQQSRQTDQETSEDQADRQEVVLARQIAKSAFDMGLSVAGRGVGESILDKGKENVRHRGGEFDLGYSNLATERINKIHWNVVDIAAEGRFPAEPPQKIYRITATVKQGISEDVNAITAGGPAGFDADGPGCDECINGYDDAGGKDRHGISLPHGGDAEAVCDSLKRNKKSLDPVVGKGTDGCSIKTRTEEREEEVDGVLAAIGKTIRESNSPEVEVYDGGSVQNNTTAEDPGILYIEDGREVELDSDWHGLVFISNHEGVDSADEFLERGQITVNGKHSIKGALLMQKGSRFLLDGGGTGDNVDYNTARLLKLVETLPMLGEPIVITDRSGEIVSN